MGQQHLRHLDAEPLERFFIGPHQPALPDGRGRLLDGQAFRIFFQLQLRDARHDRAGGNDEHLPPAGSQRCQFAGEPLDLLGAQPHVDDGDAVAEAVADIGVAAMHHDLDAVAAAALPALPVGAHAEGNGPSSFTFREVPHVLDETHHVADGYDVQVLIRWGDPVLPGAPAFDPMAQSAAAQEKQFGYNNDFL